MVDNNLLSGTGLQSKDAVWAYGDKNQLETENFTLGDDTQYPGEIKSLGTIIPDEGTLQFGEQLTYYDHKDTGSHVPLTQKPGLNEDFVLETLNENLYAKDGEYKFTTPQESREYIIGGSPHKDIISVSDAVPPKKFDVGASGEIDTTEFVQGSGNITLAALENDGEVVNQSFEVDNQPPELQKAEKIDATTVQLTFTDPGPAEIEGDVTDKLDYTLVAGYGAEKEDGQFEVLDSKSGAQEKVVQLQLPEKLKFHDEVRIKLKEDKSITDTADNELDYLPTDRRTVSGLYERPPDLKLELGESQGLTVGDTVDIDAYARVPDQEMENRISDFSVDASSINPKAEFSGGKLDDSCNGWSGDCIHIEEEVKITRGVDGDNTISASADFKNGKVKTDESLELDIASQLAQEIKLKDADTDGWIDTAIVEFETDLDKNTFNPDHWNLIRRDGTSVDGSSISMVSDSGGQKLRVEFVDGIDTTDASVLDVRYDSDIEDSTYLETEDGERVPSFSADRIVEEDRAAPVPEKYRLQENYDMAVLEFSEPIESAEHTGDKDFIEDVSAVPKSSQAVVEFDQGVSQPNGDYKEKFKASDSSDNSNAEKISRNEGVNGETGFVALTEGWNVVSLPEPGSVVSTGAGENLNGNLEELSCVEDAYKRMGEGWNQAEDLSHREGAYVEAKSPCVLEYQEANSVGFPPSTPGKTGQGWNLVSPFYQSDGSDFKWFDDASPSSILSDAGNTEQPTCDSENTCEEIGESELNVFDAYWVKVDEE